MFPTHPQTIIRSAVYCSLASRRNRARLPLTDFPFDLPDLLADLRCRCADGPGCPCVCIGPLAFRCVSVDSRLNKGPGHPSSKVMLPANLDFAALGSAVGRNQVSSHHCGSAQSRFHWITERSEGGVWGSILDTLFSCSLSASIQLHCTMQYNTIPPALELAYQSLDGGEVPRECRIAWRIGQAIRQMATVRVAGSSSKLPSLCKRQSQGP